MTLLALIIKLMVNHLYKFSPLSPTGSCDPQQLRKAQARGMNGNLLKFSRCCGSQSRAPNLAPPWPAFVPQEHLKIARSFNCGSSDRKSKIPQGRPGFSKYNDRFRQSTCGGRARHSVRAVPPARGAHPPSGVAKRAPRFAVARDMARNA